ncbi:MAG: redox-regulated ATPase YchF [Methanosarcinales archaeon]|nr:redox-regulated ATPase YchF [Methanosarcinales archaeon]
MSMSIGLAGKPNSGKSTFFKSATLADIEIANYPFTTIDANHGIAYVRTKCPCTDLDVACANCKDGVRFVAIEAIDVAGLVPDAHKGRGLGNAFLDNLRQAQAIIHVVDASGGTDAEGNPVDIGEHDPLDDIGFLEYELTMWICSILKRNWNRLSKRIQAENLNPAVVVADQLAGAGVSIHQAKAALSRFGEVCARPPHLWDDPDLRNFADLLRIESKPMIIAANKADIAPEENIKRLCDLDYTVIPTSAEAELALRMADKSGAISYVPGDSDFEIVSNDLSDAQIRALDKIRDMVTSLGGTGIQQCINTAVFDLLDQIVVYPVEDEARFTDKKGNVLPDAFLMRRGSTAHDLAYQIHTDIGEGFLHAVDARQRMRMGRELEDGDVVKIISTR